MTGAGTSEILLPPSGLLQHFIPDPPEGQPHI
jgi:hypothetical protein